MIKILKQYIPENNTITSDFESLKISPPPVGFGRVKSVDSEIGSFCKTLFKTAYGTITEIEYEKNGVIIHYAIRTECHKNAKKGIHKGLTCFIKI